MSLSNKRILILDDDENFRLVINKILSTQGAIVDEFFDVYSALESAKEISPDLILLDIELGDDSGLNFLREKNKNPDFENIPVICISSHSMSSVVKEALALGAVDFVVKPIQQKILIRKILNSLRKRKELAYHFSQDEKMNKFEIHVTGELIHLAQASCRIRSNGFFSNKQEFKIYMKGFAEKLKDTDPVDLLKLSDHFKDFRFCHSYQKSQLKTTGTYDTLCVIHGVSEKEMLLFKNVIEKWREIP